MSWMRKLSSCRGSVMPVTAPMAPNNLVIQRSLRDRKPTNRPHWLAGQTERTPWSLNHADRGSDPSLEMSVIPGPFQPLDASGETRSEQALAEGVTLASNILRALYRGQVQ